MPANKKYLTTSPWQRFAKISAGFLGGYFVTVTFHLALAAWFDRVNIMISSTFTGFIIWATLLIVTFLAKNGWKMWGVYLLLTALFYGIVQLGKMYHPII
ncbi:hypothetical protein [Joostella sp. CR20]|uniref:hypothetical protein n=1 Tax=Joostella sp. CR20 TaxID=2804312 RepID=UPI00313AEAE9